MQNINKNYFYILLVISFILIVWSFIGVFNFSKPLRVQEYNVHFIVDVGSIGLNTDTTRLTFGQINPGGGAKREVIIINDYNFPVEVKVLVSENILDLVNTNSTFVVEPNKNVTVPVRIHLPSDFELGEYVGEIRFEIYEAK